MVEVIDSESSASLVVLENEHFGIVDCPAMGKERETKWPEAAKWITVILGGLVTTAIIGAFTFYFTFGQRLTAVETDIAWIKSALKLTQAAQRAASPGSVQEVTNTTSELRARGIKLDKGLVSAVGDSFLKAAKQNPGAWPAVVSLLGYKSFLNEETAPKFDLRQRPVDPTKYHMSLSFTGVPPGQQGGLVAEVRVYGAALGDKSALLDDLQQPQVAVPGYELIVVNALGGSIGLDNARMKHVILMNAKVTYSGGLISLDDVQFVNCSFEFNPTPAGFELAESILSAPTARFEHIQG